MRWDDAGISARGRDVISREVAQEKGQRIPIAIEQRQRQQVFINVVGPC